MMKRRHTGHMGNNNNMGGGSGGHRRPQGRYNNNQGGGYQNRPRKNYAALYERYKNQASDALRSGDRVLAEYYFQHADHYFRMQQEFLAERGQKFQQQGQSQQDSGEEQMNEGAPGSDEPETDIPNNSNVMPAFLTRPVTSGGNAQPPAQNWEEE